MSSHQPGNWTSARQYLDPEIRELIRDYFHGNVKRAYDKMELDIPEKVTRYGNPVQCGQNEFYRAMRGEEVNGEVAAFIWRRWALTPKIAWRWREELIVVPDDPEEFKEWMETHIGSLKQMHEKLFPDWSYSKVQKAAAGSATEKRQQEFCIRLDRFRQRKRHQLRARNARLALEKVPPEVRRGNLKRRHRRETERRNRTPNIRRSTEE